MTSQASGTHDPRSTDESEVRSLYQWLLDRWNQRNARDMAALFATDGSSVGFDGSQLNGRAEIESVLGQIFADHPTAAYVGKVRSVRFLTPKVAVLRAVAGMVPQHPRADPEDLSFSARALFRPTIRWISRVDWGAPRPGSRVGGDRRSDRGRVSGRRAQETNPSCKAPSRADAPLNDAGDGGLLELRTFVETAPGGVREVHGVAPSANQDIT